MTTLEPFMNLEQLQQFANELGIHIILAKTRKTGLQQFGKPTWQK
jgi:hypothetical protein